MLEENSEKLTINVSVVDLGKIDYLVQNGFYGNRTDFLRTAIKSQLNKHDKWLEEEFVAKIVDMGIVWISKDDLHDMKLKDLTVVGMLYINDSVKLEDLKSVFRKIKVFGKVKCSEEIKKYYGI